MIIKDRRNFKEGLKPRVEAKRDKSRGGLHARYEERLSLAWVSEERGEQEQGWARVWNMLFHSCMLWARPISQSECVNQMRAPFLLWFPLVVPVIVVSKLALILNSSFYLSFSLFLFSVFFFISEQWTFDCPSKSSSSKLRDSDGYPIPSLVKRGTSKRRGISLHDDLYYRTSSR